MPTPGDALDALFPSYPALRHFMRHSHAERSQCLSLASYMSRENITIKEVADAAEALASPLLYNYFRLLLHFRDAAARHYCLAHISLKAEAPPPRGSTAATREHNAMLTMKCKAFRCRGRHADDILLAAEVIYTPQLKEGCCTRSRPKRRRRVIVLSSRRDVERQAYSCTGAQEVAD